MVPAQFFLAGACTPYTVASTARTVPQGEHTRSKVFYVVPAGAQSANNSSNTAMPGFDLEQRFGLDDRSDIGIRIPTISGAIVTYKRRLTSIANRDAGGTTIMLGALYDRSALKLRRGDLVVVPAITVHGAALMRMLTW